MEVGGEEVEASRGGVDLILSGESLSRRSGGARPCCDPGRGNRGRRRPGEGLGRTSWAVSSGGPKPKGRPGALALFLFLLVFPFSFLLIFKLFCFSYFRPLRHFAKMLVHHQYYQKNMFHMMNILVFMSEHFLISHINSN